MTLKTFWASQVFLAHSKMPLKHEKQNLKNNYFMLKWLLEESPELILKCVHIYG